MSASARVKGRLSTRHPGPKPAETHGTTESYSDVPSLASSSLVEEAAAALSRASVPVAPHKQTSTQTSRSHTQETQPTDTANIAKTQKKWGLAWCADVVWNKPSVRLTDCSDLCVN